MDTICPEYDCRKDLKSMKNLLFGHLPRIMNNMKFRYKMLLFSFFFVLLPFTILGFMSIHHTTQIIRSSEEERLVSENERARDVLFQLTSQMDLLTADLASNEALSELVTTSYTDTESAAAAAKSFDAARKLVVNYSSIASIHIYHENPQLPDTSNLFLVTDEIRQEQWYQDALASHRQNIWYYDAEQENGSHLHLMKYVYLSRDESIVLQINISDNYLNLLLLSGDMELLLGLDGDRIVYSSNSSLLQTAYPFSVSSHSGASQTREAEYEGETVLLRNINLTATNSTSVFQITTIDRYQTYLHSLNQRYLITILGIILVLIAMILLFTVFLEQRIEAIRDCMRNLRHQKYELDTQLDGDDEFGELYKDITYTIDVIRDLNTRLYEKQLHEIELQNEQNKIRYESLCNQINPHFLFNSLETIHMKAIVDGQQELADIIETLGSLLQYALRHQNTTVPLQSELEYIENYFQIQKFRFGSRFNYLIRIDPALDPAQIYVLPLMIQPLVENVFSHANITRIPGGKVTISVLRRQSILHIDVIDNGSGISEEKRIELNYYLEHSEEYKGKSIGIMNVNRRIKLFYGETYGLRLQHNAGEGTTFSVQIPLGKETENESIVY